MALGLNQPLTEMRTKCISWQPYHHPVLLSWTLGTLTSWNPLGHSRPVTGLLYFYIKEILAGRLKISFPLRLLAITVIAKFWLETAPTEAVKAGRSVNHTHIYVVVEERKEITCNAYGRRCETCQWMHQHTGTYIQRTSTSFQKYTGRFVMYSEITKIYHRRTVGHVFTKPVQIAGTTENFFPQYVVFHRSSHFCR
jgi:hypothetical protein